MTKYIVGVEGMMCGMCEASVNDSIRNNFKVKSVSSSHSKNQTEIIAKEELDEEAIKKVITDKGYTVTTITSEPYEKKGLFK